MRKKICDEKKPKLTLIGPAATGTAPPRQLGKPGADLWRTVLDQFDISDAGGVETLLQVCQAQDRLAEIADQIASDGLMVCSKSGPKEHPLLRAELGLRSFVVRGLTRLGITLEPLKSPGRPNNGGTGWRGNHADE